MSTYICEKCGTIDNSATGGYWGNLRNKEPLQCSKCNTGKWHGRFPKEHWSSYGVDEVLKAEAAHDGSMVNGYSYLSVNGFIPKSNDVISISLPKDRDPKSSAAISSPCSAFKDGKCDNGQDCDGCAGFRWEN